MLVPVCMIAMFGGMGLFFMAAAFGEDKEKSMRTASVCLFLGGIIGGCFATPSRGMPNGMPGAFAISMLLITAGAIMIAAAFFKKRSEQSDYEKKSSGGKHIIVVAIVVFVLFIVAAFADSSSGSNSDEPWKELGVSKREYMEIYNYYKYGR